MRDIIRCGLAMIVCFGALAGIYVILGAPLVAAAQVLVYIGAISVLILFAIMLTQTKSAPSRLVFQTQAVPAAVAAVVLALVIASWRSLATDWGERRRARPHRDRRAGARSSSPSYVLPFEVVSVLLLAAVIGGVFLAKREREPARSRDDPGLRRDGPRVGVRRSALGLIGLAAGGADSLDAYLILSALLFAIGMFGFLARRNAISMLMSIELMLNAVNLVDRRVRRRSSRALGATGSVIALMVMAVAAAEATVGLAIVIAIFRNKKTPLVDEYDAMRQ